VSVCASGCDFTTISSALPSLTNTTNTINVAAGTYNETSGQISRYPLILKYIQTPESRNNNCRLTMLVPLCSIAAGGVTLQSDGNYLYLAHQAYGPLTIQGGPLTIYGASTQRVISSFLWLCAARQPVSNSQASRSTPVQVPSTSRLRSPSSTATRVRHSSNAFKNSLLLFGHGK
jgi:hypothetical protein